jgi:hypothetical protein
MRDTEAEVGRLMQRYDAETAAIRFRSVLRGDPADETTELVAAREADRQIIVARLRQEISDGH